MKKWYASKTIWLNLLGFVLVSLEYAGTINLIDPTVLALLGTVANIMVRFITQDSVERSLI